MLAFGLPQLWGEAALAVTLLLLLLGTYSVLYAYIPGAAVAGYLRHLSALSPAAALVALGGLNAILDRARRGRSFVAIGLGLLVALGAFQTRLPEARPDQLLAERVVQWLRTQGIEGRRVLSSNLWIQYYLDRAPYKLLGSPLLHHSLLDSTRSGDLIVWDARLAPKSWIGVPRAIIESSGLHPLRAFREDAEEFVIYERP